jgi:hypothetical protein
MKVGTTCSRALAVAALVMLCGAVIGAPAAAAAWPKVPKNFLTPCDFKGLLVGAKLTPAAAMAVLGIQSYKTNPKKPSFEQSQPNVEKYGLLAAAEMEDWKIGPYCAGSSCEIPFGVRVGNDSTPVSVHVAFRNGIVTEIDVSFNETYWDDLLPIISNKYGNNWREERRQDVITDLATKQKLTVEWITMNHRNDGYNKNTGDRCQIWASNYDMVFTHHDFAGPLHSILAIKLVSKNF